MGNNSNEISGEVRSDQSLPVRRIEIHKGVSQSAMDAEIIEIVLSTAGNLTVGDVDLACHEDADNIFDIFFKYLPGETYYRLRTLMNENRK